MDSHLATHHSPILYFLSDNYSLQRYKQGEALGWDELKSHLFLLQRRERSELPDHYLRISHEAHLKEIGSLADFFTLGLPRLAQSYLITDAGRESLLYVDYRKVNDWQELLTYMPPLVLISAFLYEKAKDHAPTLSEPDELRGFILDVLEPNLRFTALPHPYIPDLEHFVTEQRGLHDLHIHLNGSTESDIVWQSLLSHVDKSLSDAPSNSNKAYEHLTQEGLRNYIEVRDLLHTARSIRDRIAQALFFGQTIDKSLPYYLAKVSSEQHSSASHPLRIFFDEHSFAHHYRWLSLEAALHICILQELAKTRNETLAALYHYYLLIQGVCHRMMVQQKHQNGFLQFQRVSDAPFRWVIESEYAPRFLQLHGNQQRNIHVIEGRFAPKATERENKQFLAKIARGWAEFLSESQQYHSLAEPQLNLVAHFIKKPDDTPKGDIRHKRLRKELWYSARALVGMMRSNHTLCQNLVGADAAASEFDTQPEVFAPVYRYMRHHGMRHFTYHAGEDFYHIFSGLRAIYEAVEFCALQPGNRIGHGVAMGINPELWGQVISQNDRRKSVILMPRGMYLDDLTFLYTLLVEYKEHSLNDRMTKIENKMLNLYDEVYHEFRPAYLIAQAWKARRYCPLHFLEQEENYLKSQPYYHELERQHCVTQSPELSGMLMRYHDPHHRKRYDEAIAVNVFELFSPSEIEKIQRLVLRHLHSRGIVIEALPTSNLRIGHYSTMDAYHLWIWRRWQQEGRCIPPLVLGTDDAGIFSTNIFNEYANVYSYLTQHHQMGRRDVMCFLRELAENARIYQFRSAP